MSIKDSLRMLYYIIHILDGKIECNIIIVPLEQNCEFHIAGNYKLAADTTLT